MRITFASDDEARKAMVGAMRDALRVHGMRPAWATDMVQLIPQKVITKMIPKTQFRRAVERFERAVRCLKCVRAEGPRERVSILYEYRDAKRSLVELGNLLITGEVPPKSYGPAKSSENAGRRRTLRFQKVSSSSKPKSPEPGK